MITFCRTKSIDGDFYIATYDLDAMISNDNFNIPIRIGSDVEFEEFKNDISYETGTIINITKLDNVSNSNVSQFKDILKAKLGSIYKYFIDEMNISIFVNEERVIGFDPMYRHESFSECMTKNEKFNYGEHEIKFSVYNLEFVDTAKSNEISRNSSNAGLYIYRNNRLVGSGVDLGIVRKEGDGHLNGFRVEMFIDGSTDNLFGSTFNKMIHEKDKNDVNQGFRDVARGAIKGYISTIHQRERLKSTNRNPNKEDKEILSNIVKDINKNKFIDIKKERGMNTPSINREPKKETIKIGSKPGQIRNRDDKFTDYRFVTLGENGTMFRTVKENGLYIIEINQDHPFWSNFLSSASIETKNVIIKFLISLGISLEETSYYDDSEKENMLNEYFFKVSDNLRKLILY